MAIRPRIHRWLPAAAALAACTVAPQPLRLGLDECERCRMTVSDARFAGQLLTRQGRSFTFDSVECLAGYLNEGRIAEEVLHSAWVMDFSRPDRWLRAEEAVFVLGGELRSPMGVGLTAHHDREAAAAFQRLNGGDLLDWDGVRTHVARVWAVQGAPHVH